MEKYIFDERNGLWYELQGDYYMPCLKLPEEEQQPIGVWGQRHLRYLKENRRVLLSTYSSVASGTAILRIWINRRRKCSSG